MPEERLSEITYGSNEPYMLIEAFPFKISSDNGVTGFLANERAGVTVISFDMWLRSSPQQHVFRTIKNGEQFTLRYEDDGEMRLLKDVDYEIVRATSMETGMDDDRLAFISLTFFDTPECA